jgi:ligand-binding SRPBCC domain-containing protein
MYSYQAHFEQWLPVTMEKAFSFFADPNNLPRVMPHWMDVRIEEARIVAPPGQGAGSAATPLAGLGSRLVASYRPIPFVPFRIRSEAKIVDFALNEFFADDQGIGPFKSWHHRHGFAAEMRDGILGTRLRDHIEYEIGFEPIGRIINLLFIAPQMRRTFAHRQHAVERLLVHER